MKFPEHSIILLHSNNFYFTKRHGGSLNPLYEQDTALGRFIRPNTQGRTYLRGTLGTVPPPPTLGAEGALIFGALDARGALIRGGALARILLTKQNLR